MGPSLPKAMMEFTLASSWECEVTQVYVVEGAGGIFNYTILSDDSEGGSGVMDMDNVPTDQRDLVCVGTKFLLVVGVLLSSYSTRSLVFALFDEKARSFMLKPAVRKDLAE